MLEWVLGACENYVISCALLPFSLLQKLISWHGLELSSYFVNWGPIGLVPSQKPTWQQRPVLLVGWLVCTSVF